MVQAQERTAVRAKKRFHHGDLREALIAATRDLLIEHGPDGFTLADACRRAGVTTAAPYKHFRDKQEIIEEIVARGFEELTAANAKAVAEGGPGTVAGITAIGLSYLDFAVAQPAVFRTHVRAQVQNQEGQPRRRKRQPLPEERHRAGGGLQSQARAHRRRREDRDQVVDLRAWRVVA